MDDFEQLLPNLPYIGEKNRFFTNLMQSSYLISLYRVLKRQGGELKKISRFLYEITEAYVDSISRWKKRFARIFY
ncbi:MAG: hypothetical protein ACFFBD_11780 [Candidatus Hodarchaeota archaeon]